MRESTWRAAKSSHWMCAAAGLALLVSSVVNRSLGVGLVGAALMGFAVLIGWIWTKVLTATDQDIDRMREP